MRWVVCAVVHHQSLKPDEVSELGGRAVEPSVSHRGAGPRVLGIAGGSAAIRAQPPHEPSISKSASKRFMAFPRLAGLIRRGVILVKRRWYTHLAGAT